MKQKQVTSEGKPDPTWRYDEGVLTVWYLGQKVGLGRYATREHAARAAAAYFAERARPPSV
jgi:hypothetical protein